MEVIIVTRRDILAMAGAAPAWLSPSSASSQSRSHPRMGGTPSAFGMRMAASGGRGGFGGRRGGEAPSVTPAAPSRAPAAAGPGFDIVEHCHKIGLYGVQTNPPVSDPEAIKKFRQRLESYEMTLVCDPRLPQDAAGVAAFENQVRAFKEAGAVAFHAALTGRRYEDMASLEQFRTTFERHQKQVELAEPVLRKYRVPLGIENHKGWRAAEQAAWIRRLGSEWVGVCLDFGNNLSLCETPEQTFELLAPITVYAHIKDMGVQEYEDGFLLSEVRFGEGVIDLKGWVDALRKRNPNMLFYLETITRDPLKVPVYLDSYWRSFDDSYSPLPGRDLARTMRLVKTRPFKGELPRTTGLSVEQRAKLEDDMNQQCIEYARKNLNL